jgi:hypothetical protein
VEGVAGIGSLTRLTFHPSSNSYEDFVEGFRPIPDALDEVERGAGGPVTGHLVESIRRAAGGAIQTVV